MNDEQLDDLKQFIGASLSQTEQRLGGRIDSVETRLGSVESRLDGVESRLTRLETKVDDGFAGVGEAIEQIHARIDESEAKAAANLT